MRHIVIFGIFVMSIMKASPSDYNFNDFSDEVKIKIFKKLDLQDIFRIRLVCKDWKRLSFDRKLWEMRSFSDVQYRISLNHVIKELDRNKSIRHLNLKNAAHIFQPSKNSIMVILSVIFKFILNFEEQVKNPKYQQLICARFDNCSTLHWEFLKDLVKNAPNLRELHLQRTNLENISFNELPVYLKNLKYLDVSGNTRFCNWNMETISQYCGRLETINLRGCKALTDNALIYLASLPDLINVGLGNTHFSNESIMLFLMSKKNLNYLDLTGYSDNEMWGIIGEYCKDLTILILSHSDSALYTHMFNMLKSLPKLEKVNLSYPKISYDLINEDQLPFNYLLSCISQVDALKISGTDVTDFDIIYILENFSKLKQLYIKNCKKLSDISGELLLNSNIKSLVFKGAPFTEDIAGKLRKKYGDR